MNACMDISSINFLSKCVDSKLDNYPFAIHLLILISRQQNVTEIPYLLIYRLRSHFSALFVTFFFAESAKNNSVAYI